MSLEVALLKMCMCNNDECVIVQVPSQTSFNVTLCTSLEYIYIFTALYMPHRLADHTMCSHNNDHYHHQKLHYDNGTICQKY
jgi:hypothetical protein